MSFFFFFAVNFASVDLLLYWRRSKKREAAIVIKATWNSLENPCIHQLFSSLRKSELNTEKFLNRRLLLFSVRGYGTAYFYQETDYRKNWPQRSHEVEALLYTSGDKSSVILVSFRNLVNSLSRNYVKT